MKDKEEKSEMTWHGLPFKIEGFPNYAQTRVIFKPDMVLEVVYPNGKFASFSVDDFVSAWRICEVITRLKEIDVDVISSMVYGGFLPQRVVECMDSLKESKIPESVLIIAAFGRPEEVSKKIQQGLVPWSRPLSFVIEDSLAIV